MALYVVAGSVFNILDGAQGSNAPGLTEANFPQVVPTLHAIVAHLLDVQREKRRAVGGGAKKQPSASSAQASSRSSSSDPDPTAGPGPSREILVARLFDSLQRLHDGFKAPWLDTPRRQDILTIFGGMLELPGSWWPQPQGKMQRAQLERWMNTMQARL